MLFDRWQQHVLPQGHIGTIWRIRLNLRILRPTRVHNRNGKWIGSAAFCTAYSRKCLYFTSCIQSRQPGLDLGAFQSRQPELNINFPVSLSPVLFHQPYSSQSIVTCMPQFPGLLKCCIISGLLVFVSDRNDTCMPICRMNCVWKHCLLLTENCMWRNFLRFYVTVGRDIDSRLPGPDTLRILYNGRPYPPELPLPMEDLDLQCKTWCFRPIQPSLK